MEQQYCKESDKHEGFLAWPNGCQRYSQDDHSNLKCHFKGSENIEYNYSEAMQDMFVLSMLDGKREGVYIELGADQPVIINNSYMLESQYGWTGVSFEYDQDKSNLFNKVRKNDCICADAIQFDYEELFKERNYPKQIDYLQLDIDPTTGTFDALKRMPFDDYRFSVITFETNVYTEGADIQEEQRIFLNSKGYQRVIKNVKNEGNPFEDWWIDPLIVPPERWTLFYTSLGSEAKEMFLK